ncbi:MAG TPA: alpha/beta hydrolase [Actinomycetes bacterium]|nr:alpha/beta hydrolase [Actinomycetes bacterium]
MERNQHPTSGEAAVAAGRPYREHLVAHGAHRLYARDHPGAEPAVVLMHGFPDNLHLYDRLVPELAGRRVVTFDFLGWGDSDKPAGHPYTAASQVGELDAVIEQLELGPVVLVAHDASGPPAINWALEHPERVAALVLLNTYYARMPGLRPPEAIRLFSTPLVRSVARPISRAFGGLLFRRMYRWQVGRFFRDPQVREEFLPLLYRQFTVSPSSHQAFFGLNRDLSGAVDAGTAALPRLAAFTRPVRIVFGAADPYLNPRVARRFHELLPTSELFLLPGARHYVQFDEPRQVAQLILGASPSKGGAATSQERSR